MKVRITWTEGGCGFGPLHQKFRDYDDLDDVSLKIHNLIMQRIAFSVEYL